MTAPGASFRQRVRAGEVLLGTFLQLGSPVATEITAQAGFDWLLVDLEHGAGSEATLLGDLQALNASSIGALVRVEVGERLRIGRALDAGANGVMVPRIVSAEQAAEVARFLRYPPQGVRGVALGTRSAGFGRVAVGDVSSLNDNLVGTKRNATELEFTVCGRILDQLRCRLAEFTAHLRKLSGG